MAGSIVINETSRKIWDFLISRIGNPYGVSAVMGNLMAECSMNPECATGKNKTEEYTRDANTGKVDFIHDGVAYGIVQWCYWSRKQGLLECAKAKGVSVGDIFIQLNYMWDELQKNKTVIEAVKNANDIRTASDVFMLRYERPATQTEAMKKRRAEYGQKYYDYYCEVPKDMKIVVAKDNVRIRSGDGLNYGQVGKLMKGNSLEWVADSNGFHAVRMSDRVGWVSGEFSEVKNAE